MLALLKIDIKRYLTESRNRSKGEEWGRALAKYAYEHPNRTDTGVQRDFIHQITLALRTRFARYADQKKRYKIDPNTFKLVESI